MLKVDQYSIIRTAHRVYGKTKADIHRELRRKAVTLMLLWQEYKQQYCDGYQYSRFCELYSQWKDKIDPVMRQVHIAGEKTFVDYAGMTVAVNDRTTGKPKDGSWPN